LLDLSRFRPLAFSFIIRGGATHISQ